MTEHEVWPGEPPAEDDEIDEGDEPEEVAEPDEDEPVEDDEDVAADEEATPEPQLRIARQHAEGELDIPDDIDVLEGEARSARRGVGVVVSRFNGEIVKRLLESALSELDRVGVAKESITVMEIGRASCRERV